MVYFVYAEPHQRSHFMGELGILTPYRARVAARDWRQELSLLRRGMNFDAGPEGEFLAHFKISNLSRDLPFIAIIGRGNRVKAFRCNEAYRARRRDGGAALRALEDQIRSAAARVFPV